MRIHESGGDPPRIPVYVDQPDGGATLPPGIHQEITRLLQLFRQVSPNLSPRADLLLNMGGSASLCWGHQHYEPHAGWMELTWPWDAVPAFYVQAGRGYHDWEGEAVLPALRRYVPRMRAYALGHGRLGPHPAYTTYFYVGGVQPHPCGPEEVVFHADS